MQDAQGWTPDLRSSRCDCRLDGVLDQLLAIALLSEVAGLAPDNLSGSVKFGLELVQVSLVGVTPNHPKAVRNELSGDRLPDASRRACYGRCFLLNASHSSSHSLTEKVRLIISEQLPKTSGAALQKSHPLVELLSADIALYMLLCSRVGH